MEQHFDIIVAGAGISGSLAAARLAESNPSLKILLLDKDLFPGGRLRSSGATTRRWSHGFNAVSAQLFEFFNQTIKSDPESTADLATLVPDRQQKVGILSGSSVTDIAIDMLFTAKGARAFGGLAAAKQWEEVTKILGTSAPQPTTTSSGTDDEGGGDDGNDDERSDDGKNAGNQAFSTYWKMPRQSPATVVLGHYASLFGIPDLWSATPRAIAERASFHTGNLHSGKWDVALDALLNRAIASGQITLEIGARIVNAEQGKIDADGGSAKEQWTVDTSKGSFTSDALLVAMPPWLSSPWLPKSYWPTSLLALISKTKPVSAVVLTESLIESSEEKLPDVILIPAEGVQAFVTAKTEVTFQATIDFEISHSAPEVVKAVKRLKRARRKLLLAYPGVCTQEDHIALVPVGWAQSPSSTEMRHIERIGKQQLNKRHLAFCGDAYGPSYDGDANIIKSVVAACETLAK